MKVDILKPSTWVPYDPANCKGCYAGCCTLPVEVSSEELFHMGFLESFEVEGPLNKVAKRLMDEGIVQTYQPKTRTFILQQKNGSDCIFLDENRLCTIYERRPSICRNFPEGGARPGFCPHQEK